MYDSVGMALPYIYMESSQKLLNLILDIASLQDLQKLVGKSALSLLMSVLKHVLSSTENLAQLYVSRHK